MSRRSLFAVLLCVGLASRLEAQATPCLKGCDPKQIPCEFWYELKLAHAAVRAAHTADSLATYTDTYNDEVRKYSKCKPNRFYRDPLPFFVSEDGSCTIGVRRPNAQGALGPFEPTSLEHELAATTSCSEGVQAKHLRAEFIQTLCKQGIPVDSINVLRQANQGRLDSLEGSLFSACTAVIDAAEPREEAKKEIATLKKAPPRQHAARSAKRSAPGAR